MSRLEIIETMIDVQPGNIETMIDVPLGNIETMIDVQPGNMETMIDVPLGNIKTMIDVQPGNIETMIGNAALICSIIQKTIHIKYKWHNDSLCINMTIKYLNDL